ncbi:hypothetical protein C8R48DRAFT_720962, partial [Suillus tomentosus]
SPSESGWGRSVSTQVLERSNYVHDPEVLAVNKALAPFGQAIPPGAYLVA